MRSLGDAVAADGRVFLLCFSDRQPGDWGPRRVTEDELRASFADGWRIDAIDAVGLDVTIQPEPVEAWRARIIRLPTS